MKNTLVILLGFIVSGCLQMDVTRNRTFSHHASSEQSTRVPCIIRDSAYMKSIWWGGWVNVSRLAYDDNPYSPATPRQFVPVGTKLKIRKIEKRNLVDHGIEVLAFGTLYDFPKNRNTDFIFEFTEGGSSGFRKAPWE